MKNNDYVNDQAIYGHWNAIKAFGVIALISVITYKAIVTPINLNIDFPTLLSLLLAFFSVGLAALFYFKATESSNAFYDNTYKFTKDIAQLLTKIESGFGERLRHLDEGYASMRDHIQKMPTNQKVTEARKRIEEEEEVIDKTAEERNVLIMQLLDKAQMQDEEKQDFINKLKEKEQELEKAQAELSKYKRRLVVERMQQKSGDFSSGILGDPGFREYVRENVINQIGGNRILRMPLSIIKHRFKAISEELNSGFLSDLKNMNIIDEEMDLTRSGIDFIREIIRKENT